MRAFIAPRRATRTRRRCRPAPGHFDVIGDHDRYDLLITHNMLIGWFDRHVLDAPLWRWIGLNQANCATTIVWWHSDPLQAEIDDLDTQLTPLVTAVAPELLALLGVGVETARPRPRSCAASSGVSPARSSLTWSRRAPR